MKTVIIRSFNVGYPSYVVHTGKMGNKSITEKDLKT